MLREPLRDIRKVFRRDRKIKQPVALRSILLIEVGQECLQLVETLIVVELGREVLHAIDERLQRGVAAVNAAALQNAFLHVRREARRKIAARYTDHHKLLRQQVLLLQVKQRRQQLALRQIARRTEDHDDARLRNSLFLQPAVRAPRARERLSDFLYHGGHNCLSFSVQSPLHCRTGGACSTSRPPEPS